MDRDESKRRYWGSRFVFLLLFLIVVFFLTYGIFFVQTRHTDDWILTGQYSKAEARLNHWKWLPIVNGRVYEELGTAELLSKNAAAADPFFKKAKEKTFFRPMKIWPDVLKVLWSNGRYSDGEAYATHIQAKLEGEKVLHFYQAGFLAGLNQLKEASNELTKAGNLPEFTKEIARLKAEIDHRSTTGQYTFIVDRDDLPVVNLTLKGDPVIVSESVKPVLQNTAFNLISKLQANPQNPAVLSIDFRIQNAATTALGKYAGAIVLLDVKKGDILAAASNPKGVHSDHPPETSLALTELYEPGSIIKMITLAGSLEHGVDTEQDSSARLQGISRTFQLKSSLRLESPWPGQGHRHRNRRFL